MGMINDRDKLTRQVLDVAYNTLTRLNNYGHHLTLIGAYSIFRQLGSQHYSFNENSRTTDDLDFNLYNLSLDETDYILFQRALRSALGIDYNIDFYALKVRPRSITYSFRVSYKGIQTRKLKIDFGLVNGEKSFDCQPLYISLATKLCLSAKLVDRRAKDKLDLVMLVRYLHPKGISKKDLLTLIKTTGNTLELDERWFTEEGVNLLSDSFSSFRGSSKEFIKASSFYVRILITGLVRNEIPLHAMFYEGKWLW